MSRNWRSDFPEYARYTKSEVTGQEYDTSVKNKAEPVRSENIAV